MPDTYQFTYLHMKYILFSLLITITSSVAAQTTQTEQQQAAQTAPAKADSGNSTGYTEKLPVPYVDIRKFLAQNIAYPEKARRKNIQGKVIIQFAVNEDGTLGEFKAKSKIGHGCEKEAIRVLSSMPPWKPGMLNGTPVKVYYTQSINFQL